MTRGAWLMVAAVALLTQSVWAGGRALDVDVERYRSEAAAGSVAIRAYEERRRPDAPDLPLTETTVTVLPRSAALLGRLDGIKAGARNSTASYREAAPGIRRVRDELERALRDAGGAALVRTAPVDPDGRVVFDAVPPGDWVVIAWRSTPVESRSAGRTRDRRGPPSGGGYRAVSVWVREIVIGAGARETVELTDRNVWFSGIEVMRAGAGR